ncbi:MAG: prolipoprotein diacylglyceryl transferase [Candidatus Adiutrix sp.]|jgi:prolipoprotein diacylglyceryl transferase|nr:prolipoprotein diacylglyceryl transferase [Candidatus Adiutrix sp.]
MAPIWVFDPVAFVIPGVGWPVRYYGIIFGCVLVAGFLFFRWQAVRAGRPEDEAYAFVAPGALGVLLGARLGHVLFYNFDRFLHDPAWMIRVWDGGLASHGATLGLILALWLFSRRWKRPFWDTCDRFSFSAAFGAAMVRLGNFLNSEIVGKVTDGPFGVRFPGYDRLPAEFTPARYPSQLAEFGLGLAILGVLLWLDRRLGREKRPRGALSAAFLILYFSGRFLVEFIKERHGAADDFILSRGQLLSLPGILLGVLLLRRILKQRRAAAPGGRG